MVVAEIVVVSVVVVVEAAGGFHYGEVLEHVEEFWVPGIQGELVKYTWAYQFVSWGGFM